MVKYNNIVKPSFLLLTILLTTSHFSFCYGADEENRKAADRVGRLMAWKLAPSALNEQCIETDPANIKSRETFLNVWTESNQLQIKEIDRHANIVLPKLFPSIATRGLDAVEYLRAKTYIDLSSSFHFRPPEELKELCMDFEHYKSFDKEFSDPLITESFDYLTFWEKNHLNK
jgi:hypothetical protein